MGDERKCVGIGRRSSECQGTQVPGEVPIWARTERYNHMIQVGAAGPVPSYKACPRVLGSIGGFSEGIIFKVCFQEIPRMDPGMFLCVGNSNSRVIETADLSGKSLGEALVQWTNSWFSVS